MSELKQASLQLLQEDVSTEADRYVVAHNVTPFYRPFVKLAYAGQQEAQLRLGRYFYLRSKDSADAELALRWLKAPAEAGVEEAQYLLGICYTRVKNFKEGALWLEKAGEGQLCRSLYQAGKAYLFLGDRDKARECFHRLACKHNQYAQYALVKLDFLPDKFLPVMAQAYGGDAEAQYELGRMYVQQIDAAKNPGSWELGLTWFRTAAEKGHEGARIIYNSLVQGN